MQLNEAIRSGCAQSKGQARYVYQDMEGNHCVMGALLLGIGKLHAPGMLSNPFVECEVFPELQQAWTVCRDCGIEWQDARGLGSLQSWTGVSTIRRTVRNMMVHLNNDHGWTREALAEWADPHPELHIAMPQVQPQEALVAV